ncbi:MAG: hypothetical protein CMF69_00210 [Magnetovibrio sp.]|nr:hypothetical protein [Magnetovibrio sp.]MBM88214.1 hypothetical protein [Gammaproteobacteria bacterium]
MGFKRKLFPKGNTAHTLDSKDSTGLTSEVDLRKEFDDIVFGGPSSIAHGRRLLLRKIRRDENNTPIKCACVDEITDEPDTENSCPYCLGEGYFWDEQWLIGYATYIGADGGQANRIRGLSAGTIRADYRIFYLRYDTEISYKDKIVELKLDTEGDPVVPYDRESIYKPQTIVRYRSDGGRTEYLAVYCNEQDAIRADE